MCVCLCSCPVDLPFPLHWYVSSADLPCCSTTMPIQHPLGEPTPSKAPQRSQYSACDGPQQSCIVSVLLLPPIPSCFICQPTTTPAYTESLTCTATSPAAAAPPVTVYLPPFPPLSPLCIRHVSCVTCQSKCQIQQDRWHDQSRGRHCHRCCAEYVHRLQWHQQTNWSNEGRGD